MPVGQGVLASVFDVGAATAVEQRLERREVARSAAYAGGLRDVLELHGLYERCGMGLGVVSQVALVSRCSEHRAGLLLEAAFLLDGLPGGFEALEDALLTVEQCGVVVEALRPLDQVAREAAWALLLARLRGDGELGVARPPARLQEWLAGRIVALDPAGAVERRRRAATAGGVDDRRRADGVVDLSVFGLSGPDAHACLSRIRACSAPVGSGDQRPVGKRRVDALVDLLLGPSPLPFGADDENAPDLSGGHCPTGCACRAGCPGSAIRPRPQGASCGCRPGSPVPCGAELSVLVPLGAALGTSGEVAELVGHGPLEPDLLADLLLASPRLRAVWVDGAGVPVAVSSRVHTPGRDDPGSVRAALLALAAEPPGPPQPRHPDDHRPPPGRPPSSGPPQSPSRPPGGPASPGPLPSDPPGAPVSLSGLLSGSPPQLDPPAPPRPRLRARAHPADTPGPYRVGAVLRRLLDVRAPRCE